MAINPTSEFNQAMETLKRKKGNGAHIEAIWKLAQTADGIRRLGLDPERFDYVARKGLAYTAFENLKSAAEKYEKGQTHGIYDEVASQAIDNLGGIGALAGDSDSVSFIEDILKIPFVKDVVLTILKVQGIKIRPDVTDAPTEQTSVEETHGKETQEGKTEIKKTPMQQMMEHVEANKGIILKMLESDEFSMVSATHQADINGP